MSYTADLTTGVGVVLDTVAGVTWRPTSTYLPDETGVYVRQLPQDGRGVALSAYPLSALPQIPVGRVGLQVMGRGTSDPDDVEALMDSLFDVLHSASFWCGASVYVTQCLFQFSAPLGVDEHGRWSRADTYWLDVDYPSTANRPG